jgi:hypothetical protein
MIVGTGEWSCVVPAVGAPDDCTGADRSGAVDPAALRHVGGVERETRDVDEACARFAEPRPARDRDGWLAGG